MADTEERTAHCACGQLRVTTTGEPDIVVACSCLECQRRTGSPLGVGAYFRREQVSGIDGAYKSFTRQTESGRTVTTNFCVDCGTSVFWELELRPEHYGIAVGCFGDPNFPPPARAVWAENGHAWLHYQDGLPVFEQAAR